MSVDETTNDGFVGDMRQTKETTSPLSTSGSTTHSEHSDKDDGPEPTATVSKKRKSTYYMRKDELVELKQQSEQLESTLDEMRGAHYATLVENASLKASVQEINLAMARMQSLALSYKSDRSPFTAALHLPRDHDQRQHILSAVKMDIVRNAIQYVLAQSHFQDLGKSSQQFDKFECDNGDLVARSWAVTPVYETTSVQLTFKALMQFLETQEMTMTEKLGVPTVRETSTDDFPDAAQVRMLSSYASGFQAESNIALFSHYFEQSDLIGRPHAVVVADSVAHDELFPYQPSTRLRKDLNCVFLIMEYSPPSDPTHRQVAILRSACVRLHASTMVTRRDLETIFEDGGRWDDVMIKSVRRMVDQRT